MLRPTRRPRRRLVRMGACPRLGQANLLMLILQFLHGVGMLLAELADAPIAPEVAYGTESLIALAFLLIVLIDQRA